MPMLFIIDVRIPTSTGYGVHLEVQTDGYTLCTFFLPVLRILQLIGQCLNVDLEVFSVKLRYLKFICILTS